MRWELIFDIPDDGRGEPYFTGPGDEKEVCSDLPAEMLRGPSKSLPALSEKELVRHFELMAGRNYGLDSGPYLLGGNTMRHVPKVGERVYSVAGFRDLHPLQDGDTCPAAYRIQEELISALKSLLGMERISLEPANDGQAELFAFNLISEYFKDKEPGKRTLMIADNSYFRGDATAQGLGFEIERVGFGADGCLRLPELSGRNEVAALFFSNPNCFGIWENDLDKIVSVIHDSGALVVNHARNVSGFLTYWSPGKARIDIILFPLNGVFGVPHFGGGPSIMAVGTSKRFSNSLHGLEDGGSTKEIRSFGPNWPLILRAYLYISLLGWKGLKRATEDSVLAANYLMKRCRINLAMANEGWCMNQFAASMPAFLDDTEIRAVDIARRLLDYGMHGPAIDGAGLAALKDYISFEPTEGSTRKILDEVAECIGKILIEIPRNPSLVKCAPHTTPVAQPKMEEACKEMLVVYTPGVLHTRDVSCGCPMCYR